LSCDSDEIGSIIDVCGAQCEVTAAAA